MAYPNLFHKSELDNVTARINQLTPGTKASWGNMSVSQMLAHCNIAYEMVYESNHPKPRGFMKFILKTFIKKMVTGPKPYKQNQRTAPSFLITGDRNFAVEKARMLNYLQKTQALGEAHFNQKESLSFGRLSSDEWNTMFSKHLDHHLTQFGA